MRWASPRRGGRPGSWAWDALRFHDLVDDEGNLLGWVREDKRPGHGFTPQLNSRPTALFPTQNTLKEAKDMLLAHFVLKKLEDT